MLELQQMILILKMLDIQYFGQQNHIQIIAKMSKKKDICIISSPNTNL